METKKTIEVFNTHITINNNRIEGHITAAKKTDILDLKNLFAQFVATCQKRKQKWINEVSKLGGNPSEGTTTGKLFVFGWM